MLPSPRGRRAPGADARLRGRARPARPPCRPPRPRRRRAQGRDPRGHRLRRVDPHGPGGRRGGRRRARPDREVARLRGRPATTASSRSSPSSSGPNRVDLARLAAVIGEGDIRRATAREANELTGFVIGGIPPIGHDPPGPRGHGSRTSGRYPVVWAAAGLPTAVFPVPPGDTPDARERDRRPDRRGAARSAGAGPPGPASRSADRGPPGA